MSKQLQQEKSCRNAFDFRQSGTPVEPKPDKRDQAGSSPGPPHDSLPATDGTIWSEQTVSPSLLHPFLFLSQFPTSLLDGHVAAPGASFSSLVQERARPMDQSVIGVNTVHHHVGRAIVD